MHLAEICEARSAQYKAYVQSVEAVAEMPIETILTVFGIGHQTSALSKKETATAAPKKLPVARRLAGCRREQPLNP